MLDAQVQRYMGMVAKADSGQEVVFDNDIDMLHSLTANKNVDLAGRMIINDKGEEVFNFGKHKGSPVLDVLKKEPFVL